MGFELQKTTFQQWTQKQQSNVSYGDQEIYARYENRDMPDNVYASQEITANGCHFYKDLTSNKGITLYDSEVTGSVISLGQLVIYNQQKRSYKDLYASDRISLTATEVQSVYSMKGNLSSEYSTIVNAAAIERVVLTNSVIDYLVIGNKENELVCSLSLYEGSEIKKLTVRHSLPDNCEIDEDPSFLLPESGNSLPFVGQKKTLSEIFRELIIQNPPQFIRGTIKSLRHSGGIFDIVHGRYICIKKPPYLEKEEISLILRKGTLSCKVEFQDCIGEIRLVAGAVFSGTVINGSVVNLNSNL